MGTWREGVRRNSRVHREGVWFGVPEARNDAVSVSVYIAVLIQTLHVDEPQVFRI